MANLKAGDLATANVDKWEPSTWPAEAKGVGFTEAPRGALAHWIKIKDAQDRELPVRGADHLERRPARPKGQIGAYEAALMNTPMAKPDAAAGDPAHHPQLRPLPGLRHARDEPGRRGDSSRSRCADEPRRRPCKSNAVTGRVLRGPLTDVYVYEAPVRLWHWVTVLCHHACWRVTGYLIGAPLPAIGGRGDASTSCHRLDPHGPLRRRRWCWRWRSLVRAVLGVRRQPPRARDLPPAGLERGVVEGPVRAGEATTSFLQAASPTTGSATTRWRRRRCSSCSRWASSS